jgi:hypothetical protein
MSSARQREASAASRDESGDRRVASPPGRDDSGHTWDDSAVWRAHCPRPDREAAAPGDRGLALRQRAAASLEGIRPFDHARRRSRSGDDDDGGNARAERTIIWPSDGERAVSGNRSRCVATRPHVRPTTAPLAPAAVARFESAAASPRRTAAPPSRIRSPCRRCHHQLQTPRPADSSTRAAPRA